MDFFFSWPKGLALTIDCNHSSILSARSARVGSGVERFLWWLWSIRCPRLRGVPEESWWVGWGRWSRLRKGAVRVEGCGRSPSGWAAVEGGQNPWSDVLGLPLGGGYWLRRRLGSGSSVGPASVYGSFPSCDVGLQLFRDCWTCPVFTVLLFPTSTSVTVARLLGRFFSSSVLHILGSIRAWFSLLPHLCSLPGWSDSVFGFK